MLLAHAQQKRKTKKKRRRVTQFISFGARHKSGQQQAAIPQRGAEQRVVLLGGRSAAQVPSDI